MKTKFSFSRIMTETKTQITENDLPQTFQVKLLGRRPINSLWGIKNTRQPVDDMVKEAKASDLALPIISLEISHLGILISHFPTPITAPQDTTKPEKPKSIPHFKKINGILTRREKRPKKEDKENLGPKTNLKTDIALMEKMKQDMKWAHDRSFFGIDSISYGVQDLIYTRVFAMIVVSEDGEKNRFHCYAFICEDRLTARALTYSLSAAFQV